MKTEKQIRSNIKRKAEAWLGILTYHCAQGKVDCKVFTRRFKSIVSPILISEFILQPAVKTLYEINSSRCEAILKPKIMKKYTPKNMGNYLSFVGEISASNTLVGNQEKSISLGDYLIAWAQITNQEPIDFLNSVVPKLDRLITKWCSSTGCISLTNVELLQNQTEAERFLSRFYRILLEATPEGNLCKAIEQRVLTPEKSFNVELVSTLDNFLGTISYFITQQTKNKIDSALSANPYTKVMLSSPEASALVEWEENKQGWGGDVSKAMEFLHSSIRPDLQESGTQQVEKVINACLNSVGRRSLLNNLKDAIKGRLKTRFLDVFSQLLKKMSTCIESKWQFSSSPSPETSSDRIRQWLFRR